MGGPRWNLVFAASFALYFHIAGLPVEKPPDSNLLRFVLNVKPGIREPTPPSPPKPPMEKVQKGTSANSGNGGINAMSVGAVFGGQSKSGQSQSQQSGGQAFGQQQGGKAGNSAATGGPMASSRQSAASASQPAGVGPAGRGPASPLPNGSGNGGAASATVMPSASASAIPQPARSQPSRQPAATVAKPAAEDPYGLEIGPGVETSATTTVVTIVTARPQTTPTPTTTTASTTTSTAATTTTTKMPPCGPDVLFVLDSTGSVRLVYDDQRRYILEVAQQMDIGPNGQHVGLILYSSKIKQRIVVGLDQPLEKEKFLQTVRELPYHGGITATGTALGLTAKALANRRSGKRTLVVVLTDGYTYDEWESPSRALQALGPGLDVIVAGDVEHYLRPVLEKIVGDPAKVLLGEENKPKVLDYLRCR